MFALALATGTTGSCPEMTGTWRCIGSLPLEARSDRQLRPATGAQILRRVLNRELVAGLGRVFPRVTQPPRGSLAGLQEFFGQGVPV